MGPMQDSAGVLPNVLIERPREIDRDRVPPDIDAESEGPWKIVLPDMSDDADELTSQAEKSQAKTCPSCESVVSKESHYSSGGQLDTPGIVSAVGQLTDQLTQLAWNNNCKRLKGQGCSANEVSCTFKSQISGFPGNSALLMREIANALSALVFLPPLPIGKPARGAVFEEPPQATSSSESALPMGEESFESWRDSTVVSMRDWTGPETTMRRKILESLRSPALNVVKSYMVAHPDATSGDLIEVLEVTFGPVESATEMLYHFHIPER
ncbi:hypothetical protein XELAEV_18030574mg [Xenopus laevis]|uniref:Paraneoplastic antigen Ma-like C-terminal domain-containing protein n=1 Tax=Xenopus laevis TaxID=8355 RepID=A0A974HEV2_XENLA|nr:hypothetical protein XELAEV_18030574mg [Xenopus laevis]